MATSRQWREFRTRVDALQKAGATLEDARAQAGLEMKQRKDARRAEIAEQKEARYKRALHCQICERDILADTGAVAHHGYERRDGFQTSSCYGARERPIEHSREVLGRYVASLLDRALSCADHARALRNGTRNPSLRWDTYDRTRGLNIPHSKEVTRDTCESIVQAEPELRRKSPRPTFDSVLASNIATAEHEEDRFRREHARQKARYEGWTQTHIWESGKWRKLTKHGGGAS